MIIHRDHGYASYHGTPGDGLGWGDPDYRTRDVNSLSNGTKYPFVFSLNCGTGHWEDRDAFGESWLRNAKGGAVGFTGAARVSYSYYNDALLVGLMDSFRDDYSLSPNQKGAVSSYPFSFRPAEALIRAKAYVMATGGSGDSSFGTLTARLFNWFGDPELKMRTKTPFNLTVSHPASLEKGVAADFKVSIKQGNLALQGAQVALVMDKGLFHVVQTNREGHARFAFTPNKTCGIISITASFHNPIPYEGNIQIISDDVCVNLPTKPTNLIIK